MENYVCSVCGYIYEEEMGIPESGIVPGTSFDDLPENWICPLCGAAKDEFENQDKAADAEEKKPTATIEPFSDMQGMSLLELSALFTNLAHGCDKQYKPEESILFNQLATYFKEASTPAENPNMNQLIELIDKDLADNFITANVVASEAKDRGALRALVWSEKVTRILKSLLTRYQKEGDAILENTGVYVCTICGFIFIGDPPPEVCPVCKVPNWKFEKIERGA